MGSLRSEKMIQNRKEVLANLQLCESIKDQFEEEKKKKENYIRSRTRERKRERVDKKEDRKSVVRPGTQIFFAEMESDANPSGMERRRKKRKESGRKRWKRKSWRSCWVWVLRKGKGEEYL